MATWCLAPHHLSRSRLSLNPAPPLRPSHPPGCLAALGSPPTHLPADSGRPRGFGFIEFMDVKEAEEAIYQLDKSMYGGREIQVGGGWSSCVGAASGGGGAMGFGALGLRVVLRFGLEGLYARSAEHCPWECFAITLCLPMPH